MHTNVGYALHTTTHLAHIDVPHGQATRHDIMRHDQHSSCIVHYGATSDECVSIDLAAPAIWVIDRVGLTGP